MKNLFDNLTASEVSADWVDEKAVQEVSAHEIELDRLRRVIAVVEAYRDKVTNARQREHETKVLTRLRAKLQEAENATR